MRAVSRKPSKFEVMMIATLVSATAACSAFAPSRDDAAKSPLNADVATKLSTLWSGRRLLTKGELPFEYCVMFAQLPGGCRVHKLSSGRATSEGYEATCRLEVSNSPHGIALFAEGSGNLRPDEPLSSFLTDDGIAGDESTLTETSKDPLYGSPISWVVSAATCQEFVKP